MRVTIGLPFFNNAATLGDAVRSIFAQTFDDWELILLDDGSTDESLKIAQSIDDDRVRVVSDGENRGLARRLNQIAQLARSEYLARIDADDLMHPTRLERQVEFLDHDQELDLVGTGMYAIDSATCPVGKRRGTPVPLSAEQILRGQGISHPTVTGRASWFRDHPYDPQYLRTEDCELWSRTFATQHLRVTIIPEPLYFYREEGSVTLSKILGSYRDKRNILRRYGPSLVGWGWSVGTIATFRAKEVLYRLADAVGQEMMLVQRRNEALSEQEQASASQTLQTILNTAVPGLPAPGCRIASVHDRTSKCRVDSPSY